MTRVEVLWAELVRATHTGQHRQHVLATCLLYQRLAATHADPHWLTHHRVMINRAIIQLERGARR